MAEITSIKDIAQVRKKSTEYGVFGLIALLLSLERGYSAYESFVQGETVWQSIRAVTAIIIAWLSVGAFTYSYIYFSAAMVRFYKRRVYDISGTLTNGNYDTSRVPRKYSYSRWGFWKAKDLAQYEQTIVDFFLSYRKAQDIINRNKRWARANEKLSLKLVAILDEFEVPAFERASIVQIFDSFSNPRKRRDLLNSICNDLAYKRWRDNNRMIVEERIYTPIASSEQREDIRLLSLEIQASKSMSTSANEYFIKAILADNRRDKIRLLKQALHEDQKQDESQIPTVSGDSRPSKTAITEVNFISLQVFARERLAGMEKLIKDADWQMCREIMITLAKFGQRGGRFNKHYYAEDTVKEKVERQCNNYADLNFEPKVFETAISYLLDQGILVTKPKTDERTISISAHVNDTKTPESALVIAMVLLAKREISGLS